MKKLFILLTAIVFFACSSKTTHNETRWNDDGKDSVKYVKYYDNNTHSWIEYYMEYRLYSMLFNQGGYASCNNYYYSHPSEFSHNSPIYKNYQSSYKSYSNPLRSGSNSSSIKSSSSSSSSTTKSYSNPSRSSNSTSTSRSYSNPSRSSSYSSHSSVHVGHR